MALERIPELGFKPVILNVKMPAIKNRSSDLMGDGLRDLYRKGEFTDVQVTCAEQTFRAHRVVLAANSEVFKQTLAYAKDNPMTAPIEANLSGISNPEAVKLMLDYIYQVEEAWDNYDPKTQEINKDVLRLASNFKIPGLTERAAHWMAKGLSTGNVVERLSICEDFGLRSLREKILEQLTHNKRALSEVAHSPQIMDYPQLMQALLKQAAGAPEAEVAQPKKKSRKG